MADKIFFDASDLPVLSHAVSIFKNLELACYATKLAGEHLTFPLKGHEQLRPLFELNDLPEKFRKRNIRENDVRKFFPKEFFPVEDAQDFLGKTLAALTWGDTVHYHEKFFKQPARFSPMAHLRRK